MKGRTLTAAAFGCIGMLLIGGMQMDRQAARADGPAARAAVESLDATSKPADVYSPPPGIPAPEFGISQTHRMYAGDAHRYDYGRGLEPYRQTNDGPYTHYVNASDANATDQDNPLGSPARPRLTIPAKLPAGSVVQVNGTLKARSIIIDADGTSARPVFVRGASATQPANIQAKVQVAGRYVILENIRQSGRWVLAVAPYLQTVPHHVAVRNCELAGERTLSSGTALIAYGNAGQDVHHVVFYRNHIYNQGDSRARTKKDRHGIAVTRHTNHIWILDNHVHHSQGDAIQINGWANETTHHVYIGGNKLHDDGENAIDIKEASFVVIAGNTMFGYEHKDGAIIAHRDGRRSTGPANVWVLYNYIHNASSGIVSANVTGSFYAMGNSIRDVADAGIKSWGSGDRYYCGNSISNAMRGIAHSGSASVGAFNNRIVNVRSAGVRLPARGADTRTLSDAFGAQFGRPMMQQRSHQSGESSATPGRASPADTGINAANQHDADQDKHP